MATTLTDTIVALSTAPGQAAIAVVRLSGAEAIDLIEPFFGGASLSKADSHTLHYGVLSDEADRPLDEVVIGLFKAPNSYTSEDVIEISCHGSPYIVQKIIELCLRNGARAAEPGEFTMRAFLNGRMDLSQAEAVADLIASESAAAHRVSMQQMRGGISSEIQVLRQKLIDFASLIELELDFGEEDVEFADRKAMEMLVREIMVIITPLIESFQLGNAIKTGINTVIAGRPNAGKSTLLNALLEEERAIVSEIAGTTRDTIEEILHIDGLSFRIIDTAGIREAQDTIEHIGVQRTLEKIGQSAILIYVFDVVEMTPTDVKADLSNLHNPETKIIGVMNKMDLSPYAKPEEYFNNTLSAENLITCSAKNKMNIPYLKEKLYEMVVSSEITLDNPIISNARHYDALKKTLESLNAVLTGLSSEVSNDMVALDIRQALYYLGEITGEVTTDDLLGNIFSKFCIGK